MDILTQIFAVIAEVISKFGDCIKNVFDSVVGLLYQAPTGSDTTGHLTVVGILSLVAVGTGLCYWAFKVLKGLIKRA